MSPLADIMQLPPQIEQPLQAAPERHAQDGVSPHDAGNVTQL